VQENARQADIEERERRTQALVKAEIGSQRRATAVGWGLARNKAAQNASATRMAQLTEDFAAVQAATGPPPLPSHVPGQNLQDVMIWKDGILLPCTIQHPFYSPNPACLSRILSAD